MNDRIQGLSCVTDYLQVAADAEIVPACAAITVAISKVCVIRVGRRSVKMNLRFSQDATLEQRREALTKHLPVWRYRLGSFSGVLPLAPIGLLSNLAEPELTVLVTTDLLRYSDTPMLRDWAVRAHLVNRRTSFAELRHLRQENPDQC